MQTTVVGSKSTQKLQQSRILQDPKLHRLTLYMKSAEREQIRCQLKRPEEGNFSVLEYEAFRQPDDIYDSGDSISDQT
ncbi:unnamed protein product [Rodentolepis nana]|uniref:ADF-H domain-containing protein n=1 Tax=Rodentolepis nana TaxID=102285 RepID=A0A0R3T5L6_RODNA|nr:unnamed protein product [Rodentolepis nana]